LIPLRRLFSIAAIVALGLFAPSIATPAAASWQAVLVAGDRAEPVFDNGAAAFYNRLIGFGVPAASIHRLSANGGSADPALEPATASRVLQRIASLQPGPGDRCLVFITSHGQRGRGIWLAAGGEYLQPAPLAQALSLGCGRVPTVVIVSGCYSGTFAGPAMRAPNRVILTAARGDRPSFGCQADRTYTVYDECLLDAIPHSATWRNVAEQTQTCVSRRETEMRVQPSQPQVSVGAAVQALSVR
jgi:hypothetical protein